MIDIESQFKIVAEFDHAMNELNEYASRPIPEAHRNDLPALLVKWIDLTIEKQYVRYLREMNRFRCHEEADRVHFGCVLQIEELLASDMVCPLVLDGILRFFVIENEDLDRYCQD